MNLDISRTDDAVRDALKKLSLLWKSRAAVNQDLPDYCGLAFDPARQDFTASLLPFRDHQADRKSTRLNSSHLVISYAVFCLKKKRTSRAGMASTHGSL